jgi:cytochrome P450
MILLITILFIVAIVALTLFYDYSNYSRIKHKETGKYIKSEMFLMSMLKIFFSKKSLGKRTLELKQKFNEKIFGSYFLGRFNVVVTCPKIAKQIFQEDSKVFIKEENRLNLKFAKKLLGSTNVVFANGENWKKQRSTMNHAFFDLTKYKKIFSDKANVVYDIINKTPNQKDFHDVMQKMTLDILGKSIFDYEFNSLSNSFQKELNSYNNFFNSFTNPKKQIINIIKEKILKMDIKNQDMDFLSDFFDDFINKSRERMKDNKEPKSVIDYMITSTEYGGLNNEEIKSNT